MLLPRPNLNESQDEWYARCMSSAPMKSEFPEQNVRAAVAAGLWEEHLQSTANSRLLEALKTRGEKSTEFGYGILTADRYVKNMEEMVGLAVCYDSMSKRNVSYHDVLEKASRTPVYSNPDMVVLEKNAQAELRGVDLPKNMLMAFKHVLTSPRQDRDNDILRTEGAIVDPKLPLLWQHCHSCPIGKMIRTVTHDAEQLVLISAIVDMNELSHDAAVMVDNDMARFSHGFRALQFTAIKDSDNPEMIIGFDITKFEIMEESIVSVPSNVDAEVQEVLVSLVESGKLTSGLMKEYGKALREKMPLIVPSGIEFKNKEGGEENEDKGTSEGEQAEGRSSGTSKETEADAERKAKDSKAAEINDEKSGRAISRATLSVLKETCEDLMEVMKDNSITRGNKALLERCYDRLQKVIEKGEEAREDEDKSFECVLEERQLTAQEAASIFLAQANAAEIKRLSEALATIVTLDSGEKLAKELRLALSR